MGGNGSGTDANGSRFPLVVGLVCAILATALFVTNTLPALRERDGLERAEDARSRLLADLSSQTRQLRGRYRALGRDPQALLVEIDALGLMPEELLAQHPETEVVTPK